MSGKAVKWRGAKLLRRLASIILLFVITALIAYSVVPDFRNSVLRRVYPDSYDDIVADCSERYGVPRDIVFAVIYTESRFNPDAVSPKGACGLMQLMPDTFDWMYEKLRRKAETDMGGADELSYDDAAKLKNDILNPETNISCGTYLLCILYSEFQDWDTAFAAYNAGIGRVRGWLKDERYSNDGRLCDIPISETEQYVKRVNRARDIYKKLYC